MRGGHRCALEESIVAVQVAGIYTPVIPWIFLCPSRSGDIDRSCAIIRIVGDVIFAVCGHYGNDVIQVVACRVHISDVIIIAVVTCSGYKKYTVCISSVNRIIKSL